MAKRWNPIILADESNGTLIMKFFFNDPADVPPGIPEREARTSTFKVVDGQRQDTGKQFNCSEVTARFLRTGIANADDRLWKLTSLSYWRQPITDEKKREELGTDTQYVVQLVYQAMPNEDAILELSRQILDTLRILSCHKTWGSSTVWLNDFGPITINFRSPRPDGTQPQRQMVVRDGALDVVPVEVAA